MEFNNWVTFFRLLFVLWMRQVYCFLGNSKRKTKPKIRTPQKYCCCKSFFVLVPIWNTSLQYMKIIECTILKVLARFYLMFLKLKLMLIFLIRNRIFTPLWIINAAWLVFISKKIVDMYFNRPEAYDVIYTKWGENAHL